MVDVRKGLIICSLLIYCHGKEFVSYLFSLCIIYYITFTTTTTIVTTLHIQFALPVYYFSSPLIGEMNERGHVFFHIFWCIFFPSIYFFSHRISRMDFFLFCFKFSYFVHISLVDCSLSFTIIILVFDVYVCIYVCMYICTYVCMSMYI